MNLRGHKWSPGRLWLGLAFVAVGAGCEPESPGAYAIRLEAGTKPTLHAIHNERLRAMMGELSRFALNRLPQEMDSRTPLAGRMEEIGRVARALADDAAMLPQIVSTDALTDAERSTFERFASRLVEDAQQLSELAEQRDRRGLNRQMQRMAETCNGCHRAFREPSR